MRLGFHYHVPALEKKGQIFLPGDIGRFIDSLAIYCDEVICFLHTPLPQEEAILDYPIHSSIVSLVNIGPHASVPRRMLMAPLVSKKIKHYGTILDVMLIRAPTPLLFEVAHACNNVPTALLLVGDYLAGVDDLPQPRWRKELIRLWSWWNSERQLSVAKRSLTFVNSHRLFLQLEEKLPNLVETRTTTLTEADYYSREDTCQSAPYHLLYTGRMAGAKGILDMVEAVAVLVNRGIDVRLDLVGPMEKGDPVLDVLASLITTLGIAERVIYHGYKPLGPELFDFYKKADIYLIASQSNSEGFPRTIWEAMAHSLPVIATKVGSIPDYLEDNIHAVLIPPKDPAAIVDACVHLIDNMSFRKDIILNAYKLSLGNQINVRSQEMMQRIQEWVLA
jgi:glycosyltransferase involved in cell wall biosynthesis